MSIFKGYWEKFFTVHNLALHIISDYTCLLELRGIAHRIESIIFASLYNKYYDAICLNSAHLFGYYRNLKTKKINKNIQDSHFKSLLQCDIPDVEKQIHDAIRSAIVSSRKTLEDLEDDFQKAILEKSELAADDFKKAIKNLTTYRNKTIAHIDHDKPLDLYHPFSEIFYKLSRSLFYYLRFISETNAGEGRKYYSANIDIDRFCEDVKKEFKETLKNISDCL